MRLLLIVLLSFPSFLIAQTTDCSVADQVDSLIQLSRAYTSEWEMDAAFELSAQAETLAREQCGLQSVAYGAACFNEGRVRYFSGWNEEAIPWYQQSLTIRGETLGKQHEEYGKSLNNLAIVYDLLGRYEAAEPLYLAALAIRERTAGRESVTYTNALSNLATMYNTMGRYEEAERFLLEVLRIRKILLGEQSVEYANTLLSLASLYYLLSQYEASERYYLTAKAIYQAADAQNSPEYQSLLGNMGSLYYGMNRSDEALAYFQKSSDLCEQLYGKEGANYALSLNQLGLVYLELEQFDKAEASFLQALERLDPEGLDYGFFVQNLADLYIQSGDYQQAAVRSAQAKANLGRWLSPHHPRYLVSLRQQAVLDWIGGDRLAAGLTITQMAASEKTGLIQAARHLSERELLSYKSDLLKNQHYYYSLCAERPEIAYLAYNEALFYRGFLLQSTQRARQLAAQDSMTALAFQEVQARHRLLAAQLALPLDEQEGVTQLSDQVNTAEKALVQTSADMASAWQQVHWRQVQRELQADEMAIEFVHYEQRLPQQTDSVRYAALVLLPDAKLPFFVPLCAEQDLLDLLYPTGAKMSLSAYSPTSTGPSLYELLWRPIEKRLANQPGEQPVRSTIYYAASGLLHQLNMGALVRPDGQVLAEQFQLRALGSTRQLVDRSDAEEQYTSTDAILYGGIQYDLDSNALVTEVLDTEAESEAILAHPLGQASSRGWQDQWNYLPWTEVEVLTAADLLTEAGYQTQTRLAATATEEHVKSWGASGKAGPRLIHLATHGYFFSESQDEATTGFATAQDPLMRSGLVLAGGNYAWQVGRAFRPDVEDGILTAYEVSRLNLSQTELVVLSACETGRGLIRDDEGVFGLQRAFKTAGVRYLIMSLWQVPDFQTQAFMTEFYTNWLDKDVPIPDAFRAAQLAMRQQFGEVSDWAGFVLLE